MKHGPFVFLGLFFALALSWLGMIVTPQLQLGNEQPTNVPPANVLYPTPYPGLAAQGREVYRANGCAYCHTQMVRQEGEDWDVVLTKPGTNQASVVAALLALRTDLRPADAQNFIATTPKTVLTVKSKPVADATQKALSEAGAEASVRIVPLGPDIGRGWGSRLSVAHDYLYDVPVMLGVTRIGPDLTDVGLRRPDEVWQLIHLYDPKLETPGSTMPRYPFLFERHKRGSMPSPGALPIAGDDEIVPTEKAQALVAFLLSLRTQLPLFEAPGPQVAAAVAGTGATNQPAAPDASTNAPSASTATNQAAPK